MKWREVSMVDRGALVSVEFESVDPATLVMWGRNPRVNEHAVPAVARSIERFGFGSPVVARPSDRRVLAGHTRLRAALELGLEAVPVRWLELPDGEADAYALADNRLGEIAEWDEAGLVEVLRDLADSEALDVAGFSELDLARLAGDTLESQVWSVNQSDAKPRKRTVHVTLVLSAPQADRVELLLDRLTSGGRSRGEALLDVLEAAVADA